MYDTESESSIFSNQTYMYNYDKKGNWVKKIFFENGRPEYIIEREYEYY